MAVASSTALAESICSLPSQPQLISLSNAVKKNLSPQPRAIPRVHTEGTLPHEGIWDASIEAKLDWYLMRQLAQLWLANRQPEDAQALSRIMTEWARVYQPSFNAIDETSLDAYIDAYVIAQDALDASTKARAQEFIRVLAEGYLKQMEPVVRHKASFLNNWQSHRIKLAALGAAALDDQALWSRARKQFVDHLGRNIRQDGSTLDFEERNALRYAVYDLEPLVRAAMVARQRGELWLNLVGKDGGSVRKALDWLVPYAVGEKTHEEFANSSVAFDAKRKAAGMPGYSGIWQPKNAATLFAMAATIDDRYASVAQKLNPSGNLLVTCWQGR
ncbi:alginate lyase [Comamonas thiooxydans]|nr:alginate lyase [Comamonas thiooxydans]